MDHPTPPLPPAAPSRRAVLKVLASGLAVPLLPACGPRDRSEAVSLQGGFSPQQLELVAEIAETILPATETPGAREADVASFIDRIVHEWMPEKAKRHFLDELASFDQGARRRQGASFVDLEPDARTAVLEHAEDQKRYVFFDRGFSSNPATLHQQGFFHLMKWLTLVGYYTSEVGMKQALGYRKIPGRYIPDYVLEKS
jgi:hypothetical protein